MSHRSHSFSVTSESATIVPNQAGLQRELKVESPEKLAKPRKQWESADHSSTSCSNSGMPGLTVVQRNRSATLPLSIKPKIKPKPSYQYIAGRVRTKSTGHAVNGGAESSLTELENHKSLLQKTLEEENKGLKKHIEELKYELEISRTQILQFQNDLLQSNDGTDKGDKNEEKILCDLKTAITKLILEQSQKREVIAKLTNSLQECQRKDEQLEGAKATIDKLTSEKRQLLGTHKTQLEKVKAQHSKELEEQFVCVMKQKEQSIQTYKDIIDKAENSLLQTQTELERQSIQHTTLISKLEETVREYQVTVRKLEARSRVDELAPYRITQFPQLGEQKGVGCFGSVYKIQLNGIDCIAKRIHDILLGQGAEEEVSLEGKCAQYQKFQHECVLLSRIRHPNIVQFMGVHYGPERDYGRELTLIMEHLYMNLQKCLKCYRNIDMWLKASILLDISQGLLHLHSLKIIHRDLTAQNILLTNSFHAKIADLGISKIIDVHPLSTAEQTKAPGAIAYMPPEALAEMPQYGFALDIFSLGVLMLYVLIQEFPQCCDDRVTPDGLRRNESHIEKRMKWISRLSPQDRMRHLICECLHDDPQKRPSTENLKCRLAEFSKAHPNPFCDILEMQRLSMKSSDFPSSLPRNFPLN